jgi:membrane-bound serine protease (ClpP class)
VNSNRTVPQRSPESRFRRWLGAFIALAILVAPAAAEAARHVDVLEIDGAISPAISDYVVRELRAVKPDETALVVLRMDTPGGLDTSMREIIRAILASPVPVATYVAPGGARAASAGTYITYASAIAAMAPGTNLGAATPIPFAGPGIQPPQPSPSAGKDDKDKDSKGAKGDDTSKSNAPEPTDTEGRKVLNDAIAYIRGLAGIHGRNADWAEQAVRNAVSLPADEALKLHVIDVIADDVPDLLRKVDGREVTVAGSKMRLATAGLEIVTIAPDWRTQFLAVITNPNIAYILMLLGVYGLFFELTNPGAMLPGVVGAISLALALFALNLLPVDYAGAALVLLGMGMMIAEAFIGAFGVIGIGGIVAFVIGSIIMFHENAPGLGLSLAVVAGGTAVTAGFFLLTLVFLLRSRSRPVVTGGEALIGADGTAVAWTGTEGRVRVMGEIWQARANAAVLPGAHVKVVARDGLVLTVEPSR